MAQLARSRGVYVTVTPLHDVQPGTTRSVAVPPATIVPQLPIILNQTQVYTYNEFRHVVASLTKLFNTP